MKFCAIGDIVFITPLFQTLKQFFPETKITFVTYSYASELTKGIPAVDTVITSDFLTEKTRFRKAKGAFHLIQQIRKLHADVLILAHRHWLFGVLGFFFGIPTRLGFAENAFLTYSVSYDTSKHEIDRYLDILHYWNISEKDSVPVFYPPQEAILSVEQKIQKEGIPTDERFIILFPGGGENILVSMPIKRWQPENFRTLIERLQAHYSYPILLIGSNTDSELCESIRKGFNNVYNFAGKFSLLELIALSKYCVLMIGGDSGPLHIMSATGTPILALFGPSDPRLVAPRGKHQRYVWKQVTCAPCYNPMTASKRYRKYGRNFICFTGTHECMKNLSVDDVWVEVRNLLNAQSGVKQ